jgi:hypothetical protein
MAQFISSKQTTDIININRNEKYKMTFDEWIKFITPIDDMFFNTSGSGNVDLGIYKWPRFGDPIINEPIGVSISITPEIIDECFKKIHSGENGTHVNSQLVNCCFKISNDNNRRGKKSINRKIIDKNLKCNGISNRKLPPKEFISDIVKSKFVISPEGNGVDTHRSWEAIYFKSIPIIENNADIIFKYRDLPVIFTNDYTEITPEYLEKKYIEIRNTVFDFSPLFVSNYTEESLKHIIRRSNHYGNKYQKIEWYPFDYSRIKQYSSIYDDICMITITNSGYKEVTKNSLASLRRLNMKLNIEVFTLDDGCSKDFIELGYKTTSLSTDLSMGSKFKDNNWTNITLSKLKVIHSVLERYKMVFLVDGDIVFDRGDFLPYVYDIMNNKPSLDLVSQIEFYINKQSLCSGFMLIRSSEKTKHFFHPDRYSENYNNDQDYLNENKNKLNYERLPLELFPNGKFFYEKKPKHPKIVHFNFVSGIQEKIKKIKKYGRWFI